MAPQDLLINLLEAKDSISVRFQPIFSVDGGQTRFHSFECLSRGPAGTNFERPDVLFEYARRKGGEGPIDRKCIETALNAARGFSTKSPVHLNIHAATLVRDLRFPRFLIDTASRAGCPMQNIIVEILEHSPMGANPAFLEAIREIRELGARIALDDIGAGDSNFKMILAIKPDFYKVDRYFVTGCGRDPDRQVILETIAKLAEDLGGQAIVEGVETQEELEVCRDKGIKLVQGYLLSRPLAAPDLIRLIEYKTVLKTGFP